MSNNVSTRGRGLCVCCLWFGAIWCAIEDCRGAEQFTITVNSKGCIECCGHSLSTEELGELVSRETAKPGIEVIVLCDPKATFDRFDRVMWTIAERGSVIRVMIGELATTTKPDLHRYVFPAPDGYASAPWYKLIDNAPAVGRTTMSRTLFTKANMPDYALLTVLIRQGSIVTLGQKLSRAEFGNLVARVRKEYRNLTVDFAVSGDTDCARVFDVLGLLKSRGVGAFCFAVLPKPNEEHMSSKTRPIYLQLFREIDIGDSEQTVIAKSDFFVQGGWMQRYVAPQRHDYRSCYIPDNRYLSVQFSNAVVVSVGILKFNVGTNKPPEILERKPKYNVSPN